jgi:hypothetical protein
MKVNLNTFLIVAGFIVFWFLSQCGKPAGSEIPNGDTIRVETTKIVDNSTHEILKPVHHTYYKTDSIFIAVPAAVDTEDVIRKYFTTNVYTDTLTDSLIQAFITDTIEKNMLKARRFQYKILRPQTVVHNLILEESTRNKIFVGAFADYSPPYLSAGISAAVLNKREQLLLLEYNPFHDGVRIGFASKLSFRKK